MKKPKITIKEDALSISYTDKVVNDLKDISNKLIAIDKEYNICKCVTCKITIINKAEDIVSAELYKWFEILQGPINSPFEIEDETLDEAIIQIGEMKAILQSFNDLRAELLKSDQA